MVLFWSLVISVATVALCVLVHYEGLRLISLLIPKLSIPPRPKVLVVIAGVSIAHLIEVSLFALVYAGMNHLGGLGSIRGDFDGSAIDYLYFSITSFTTLGIGDLFPHGGFRLLVGFQALTGFGLIGWSVTFTFMAMQQFWSQHPPRHRKPTAPHGP